MYHKNINVSMHSFNWRETKPAFAYFTMIVVLPFVCIHFIIALSQGQILPNDLQILIKEFGMKHPCIFPNNSTAGLKMQYNAVHVVIRETMTKGQIVLMH